MAKMRGIKPETFTDSKIVRMSPLARYLFIGLWTQACDNGHVDHDEMEIKIRLLPADNADVTDLLTELETGGLIETDHDHITIPNLTKHQKVDKRWFKTCDKPGCLSPSEQRVKEESRDQHGVATTSTRRGHHEYTAWPRDQVESDRDELNGSEGELNGSEGEGEATPTRIRPDFMPSAESVQEIANQYPHFDTRAAHPNFVDYWLAATGDSAKKQDWDAAWRKWMREDAKKESSGYRNQNQIIQDMQTRAAQSDLRGFIEGGAA